MTLSIPTPVGATFAVVIKNSGGTTVYSATHGNEDFDPGITTPGDYTMYVDGRTDPAWCFTISECECPVVQTVSVELVSGSYYGTVVFDMSGGFSCPFKINVETDFTTGSFSINSLADLTLQTGSIYYRQFLIGGVGNLGWSVTLLDGTICDSGYIGEVECVPPTLQNVTPYDTLFRIAYNGTTHLYTIVYELVVGSCDAATCTGATVNYLQINGGIVGAPDSGTVSVADLCSGNFIGPYGTLTPNTSYPGHTAGTGVNGPRYQVTLTTCCGDSYSDVTRNV